jgi:hypothetical protein
MLSQTFTNIKSEKRERKAEKREYIGERRGATH